MRLFGMAQPAFAAFQGIKDDSHAVYMGLRGLPMKSAPDQQQDDGADRGRYQRAPEAEHGNLQHLGKLAADKGAANADQHVGEDAVGGLT